MRNSLYLFLLFFAGSYAQEDIYNIVNLNINNDSSHYGLVFYENNKVYFSAPVLNNENLRRKKNKKNLIYSLFEGKRNEKGQIHSVKRFEGKRNADFNSSSAIVSPDGKFIYITTNYSKLNDTYKKKHKSFNLFIERGEYVEGRGWINFKRLSFCDPNYSYGHPALSPDGNTLYFISNIPSAKGPTDIFKVSILGDNEFSKPTNLGELVNSVRKEMFPFIDEHGVLYFSSDRALGMGGLDIYKSQPNEIGGFITAELMPSPVNSRYDDFCYVIDYGKKEGYFSSKRPNGKGEDDIYYFTIKEKPSVLLASGK